MSESPKDTVVKDEASSRDMNAIELSTPFMLGEWLIDPVARTATRGAEVAKIDPRNMRVLQILAERHGQVVSQRELEAIAWEGVVVTPDSLYQSIRQLRQALQDTKSPARYIETVPRRGYRMVAEPRAFFCSANEQDSSELAVNDRDALHATESGRWRQRVVKSRLILLSSIMLLISVSIAHWYQASLRADEDVSSVALQRSLVTSDGLRDSSISIQLHGASYNTLRALGMDALSRGNPHEAIEYFEQAFRRHVSDAGEKNEFALGALTDIANAYMWLDNEAAAHDAAAKAVGIANQLGPHLSSQRIWSVSVLAEALVAFGDYSKAEPLIVDLVDASRRQFGIRDLSLFDPLYTLALLRFAQGRLPEAEHLAREAVSIAVEVLGAQSTRASPAKMVLAAILVERNEFEKAEQEARAVIDLATRNSSDQPHPREIAAKHVLAEALMGKGEYLRAEIQLKEELKALEEIRAVDWRIARAASALGEVYMRTHRLAEAERYLSLAKRKLTRTKGWPIEREVRNLARRLEELEALRPKQVSALTN